jgi:hypothetical protein
MLGSLDPPARFRDEQADKEYLDGFVCVAYGGAVAAGNNEPEDDGQRRVPDEDPSCGVPVLGQLGNGQVEGSEEREVAEAVEDEDRVAEGDPGRGG